MDILPRIETRGDSSDGAAAFTDRAAAFDEGKEGGGTRPYAERKLRTARKRAATGGRPYGARAAANS